jgi:lysozyme
MSIQKKHVVGGTTIVALIAAFIAPQEGLRTKAYRDPVGIWTICTGETQGVYPGQTKTEAECRVMLARRIPDYLGPVDTMMPGLPDNRRVAYTDFAYNIGVAGLRKSGIPVLERSGKWQQACAVLKRYVYAGGRVLPGLVTRREKEYQTCIGK